MLLKQSLPEWAVREAGAPAELWTEIISPPYSDNLFYDVIWVKKTPTRLPEVGGPLAVHFCHRLRMAGNHVSSACMSFALELS